MSDRKNIPPKFQALYKKAISGKSRTSAMRMQCIECCGYSVSEVRKCTDKGCPLFNYRPTAEDVKKRVTKTSV